MATKKANTTKKSTKKIVAVKKGTSSSTKKNPKKIISVSKAKTTAKSPKKTVSSELKIRKTPVKSKVNKLEIKDTEAINEVSNIEEVSDTKKVVKKSTTKKTNRNLKIQKVNKASSKKASEKTVEDEQARKERIKEDKKKKKEKIKIENDKKRETKKTKEPVKEEPEIKEDNTSKESIKKENLKKKKKNKSKGISKPFKIVIAISVICAIILIVEGILLLNHRSFLERNVVYHDTYTGGYLEDDVIALAGSTDFKHGNFNLRIKDNERAKITIYDDKGNVTLEKVYKKGITTTFNSILVVEDGYIAVGTGVFSKEELEKEAQEGLIVKFSKEGKVEWEKFYQVLTNTSFNKIIRVGDDFVVVGQSIYANMEMGNHTTGGAIIVKYDKNGNELWHNNHGGSKSGNFNDIVYVNGNYYAVGKDGTDWGNIVKFNGNGEYEWHKNYAYTDEIGFTSIVYADNALYVVGSKKILPEGITDDDDRSTLNTDALFLKYDMDGNLVFEKTYGGSSYERYNGLTFYHNNFYAVGHTCSNDAGVKVTTDKKDEMTGFIIRYDINANILKKEPLGGSNNDNLVDIVTDGISFYIIGYSNSKDGNMTVGHSNGKDYHGRLIKLNNKFQKLFVK